jgi:hypothetical protein
MYSSFAIMVDENLQELRLVLVAKLPGEKEPLRFPVDELCEAEEVSGVDLLAVHRL